MNTAILYSSKHSTTEKCSQKLATEIGENVKVFNLKNDPNPKILEFDSIIIGGSIHAGKIQSKIKKYCQKNIELLKEKKLGLFICCMDEKKAQEQLEKNFPPELLKNSVAKGLFGGEFIFEKMNFLEKFIIKKISKLEKSVSKINEENIKKFAKEMK